MSRDELNSQDRLNDYLDAVVTWSEPHPVDLDPDLHEKVQRLFALGDSPDSPVGLSKRIWENMMSQSATARPYSADQPVRWTEQIRNRPRQTRTSISGSIPTAPGSIFGRIAKWAVTVVLLLGLGAGYLAYGPLPPWARHTESGPAIMAPLSSEDIYPMVGTWLMDQDVSRPGKDFAYVVFHSDGTVVETEPTGDVYVGIWAPTGENSIGMEVYSQNMNPPAGMAQSRSKLTATFVYDAAGNTFTGTYRYVMTKMEDGSPLADFGGDSSGHRIEFAGTDGTPTP